MIYETTFSSLALYLLLPVILYRFLVYPNFVPPLSRIPKAHWSSAISSCWILWIRYSSLEISTIHEAHKKYGPVIRLAPNEISVNCVKGGIQTVYSGGFEKHEWYSNLFDNYGIPNMFSTSESKPHSIRKRMLSNVYSKSYILNSPTMVEITRVLLLERFLPTLASYAQSSAPFDIYSLLSAVTMDFVTSYQFGLASNADLLRDKKQWKHFLGLYGNRQSYNFWPQELPHLTSHLKRLGLRLVPKWVDEANKEIETWTLKMCDNANRLIDQNESASSKACDLPIVYQQLHSALKKTDQTTASNLASETTPERRLVIASEMLDHLAAGFDTSGITLTYFIHELSQRPDVQSVLRAELHTLDVPLRFPPSSPPPPTTSTSSSSSSRDNLLPSAKALDALPLLQATLQETLRLRAAIPGPEPRITPSSGGGWVTLGPEGSEFRVPGGVRVSAQAYSLHRNGAVFADPEAWEPSRWLRAADDPQLREMNRWFWAFGSGGRMCVGSNLAIYQMKFIIAAIYTNFETIIVDDNGIEQKDIYTAPPKSGKLIIKLQPVSS